MLPDDWNDYWRRRWKNSAGYYKNIWNAIRGSDFHFNSYFKCFEAESLFKFHILVPFKITWEELLPFEIIEGDLLNYARFSISLYP